MTSLCCLVETLSVTLKETLTFKTSTLQMQALIKSRNMASMRAEHFLYLNNSRI